MFVSTGCPFRHSDIDILRQKLQSLSVSAEGVGEVFSLCSRVLSDHFETNNCKLCVFDTVEENNYQT